MHCEAAKTPSRLFDLELCGLHSVSEHPTTGPDPQGTHPSVRTWGMRKAQANLTTIMETNGKPTMELKAETLMN